MAVISRIVDGGWTHDVDGDRTSLTYYVDGQASGDVNTMPVEVPRRGDVHPDRSDLMAVSVVTSHVAGQPQQFIVRVEYATPSPENSPQLGLQRIELDSTIVEEQTNFDVTGARIFVNWNSPLGVVSHNPQATTLTNLTTVTVTKTETVSTDDLVRRAARFVGAVNDAVWFGWPAKTWKLDDIEVRKFDEAEVYQQVKYALTYNAKTWRLQVGYTLDGAVAPGATEGDGLKTFDVIKFDDFTLLPIVMPTMV